MTLRRRLSAMCFAVISAAGTLFADGGTMQFRKPAGPFMVTVFSEPVPVRAGIADLSVMVEKGSDQSGVLDADVKLHLKKTESGRIVEIIAPASHSNATNKLLYAASVTLPSAGTWQITVDVREKGDAASASGNVTVWAAEAPMMERWPLFAVVPLMILFFVLNQWLRRRRNTIRASLQR